MKRALAIAAGALPPFAVAAWYAPAWAGSALLVSTVFAFAIEARRERRLRTLASVLSAYRAGDYAIRARRYGDGALGEAMEELNGLGEQLRGHRLGEIEAWNLLAKVMAEIDAVIVAVDDDGKIRLANAAAEKFAKRPIDAGDDAAALGFADFVTGPVPRTIDHRWELRRGTFRLSGLPHTLVVLSDVSRALREQERDAWRRIIRVMGHEINSSLSPIRSIADTLSALADPAKRQDDWESDLRDGLAIVARRAEALGRFMDAYAKLARLPPPALGPVSVSALVAKAAALVPSTVEAGDDVVVQADPDQLEQVLINLLKNAKEAAKGSVAIGWRRADGRVTISVLDDGPGVSDTTNLFTPFFTTKPGGSGIGLALSRQIIEAHGGTLALESRSDGAGAVARIELPVRD